MEFQVSVTGSVVRRTVFCLVLFSNVLLVTLVGIRVPFVQAQMAPSPKLTYVLYYASLELGQWATISVNCTNTGGSAVHQILQISFPDNLSTDNIQIDSSDLGGYPKLYPTGSTLGRGYGNGTVTSTYPVIEGENSPWTNGEKHYVRVKVKPEREGLFTFYVKTVAADSNWTVQAYAPNFGPKDQQDEYVNVYSMTVFGATATITTPGATTTPTLTTYTTFTATSLVTGSTAITTTSSGLAKTSTTMVTTPIIPLSRVTTVVILVVLLLLLLIPAAGSAIVTPRQTRTHNT